MLLQTLISAQALNEIIKQDNVILLDCRFYLTDHEKGRKEYEKEHIPKAIFVDVHHELAGVETEYSGRHPLPETAVFADQLQHWGINQKSQVVVYDDMGGAIAARAWWMLSQQGINVLVLDGGIAAWREQGLPISTESADLLPSDHRFEVSFPWEVTENKIVENFELNLFQLIDARSSDRFNGENETIDLVAGHIPGAINRPFSENLNAKGLFKTEDELKAGWGTLLSDNEEYVHYCGSGITSCHNVLALNYAGIEAKRIYVGSWSQWSKRMLRAANVQV